MGQLMSDMGVVMDTNPKYFLRVQLSISQEIIDCLVILLLNDIGSMMDFAMHPSISTALRLMPLSGFTHPAVLPALMVAWAFGANWNRLILQYGKNEVDLFLVSKEDITQEFKNAQRMGIRVEVKEFISYSLRKHYGLSKSRDDASQLKNKKNKRSGTSVQSPIVVDTSYASEVDDDSEVTLLSRGGRVNTKGKQTIFQHVKNSTKEKGGLNLNFSCPRQSCRTWTRLKLLSLIHSMLISLIHHL